jgi:hypothetical protein
MQHALAPRTFFYRTWQIGFVLSTLFVLFLPAIGVGLAAVLGVSAYPFWAGIWNFVQPFNGGWLWALLIGLCIWSARRHRPVSVGPDGIEELPIFASRKRIEWVSLKEISRSITFQNERRELVETISFHADGKSIIVRSYINDFDELKAIANRYIASNRIPIANFVEENLREKYPHLKELSEARL